MDDRAFLLGVLRAVRPAQPDLIVVGGTAHRLHVLHPYARGAEREVLRTFDIDLLAPDPRATSGMSLDAGLRQLGCRPETSGDWTPPATRYVLESNASLYVQFIAPRRGDGLRRDGTPDATVAFGGVVAERLRHVDLLAFEPWTIVLTPDPGDSAGGEPVIARVCNATTFLAQKLLIADSRPRANRAKDVAYIYETVRLFGGSLDELGRLWNALVETLPTATSKTVVRNRSKLIQGGSEDVREAARILASLGRERTPSVEELREGLRLGLEQIFPRA